MLQFPGDDISQVKRDIHSLMFKNQADHFSDRKNVYTRKNFYRILEQHVNRLVRFLENNDFDTNSKTLFSFDFKLWLQWNILCFTNDL